MKGEQKHVLYQNIKISQIFTIRSIRTLFFGCLNAWNHVFQINYFFSRTVGIIRLEFLFSRSNGWHQPFEIFPVPFER